MPMKSNAKFLREVEELTGSDYTFKEEYKGANLRIEALHEVCGDTFKVKPVEFLHQNKRCPRCKQIERQAESERKRQEREAKAEPGAIVRFYQRDFRLSPTYIYATNGIDVSPGDLVVVISSIKIGVAVVTELCTIHSKGDHLGIAERLSISVF